MRVFTSPDERQAWEARRRWIDAAVGAAVAAVATALIVGLIAYCVALAVLNPADVVRPAQVIDARTGCEGVTDRPCDPYGPEMGPTTLRGRGPLQRAVATTSGLAVIGTLVMCFRRYRRRERHRIPPAQVV